MKAKLTRFNAHDFRQRHQGTFGFITTPTGRRELVHVTDVNEHQLTFKDFDGFDYTAQSDADVEFEFLPVERKWHNSIDRCFFTFRHPARQWQRGICPANTILYRLDKGLSQRDVSFDTLHEIFPDRALTKDEVSARLGRNTPTAISNAFAVGSAGTLFFFDRSVGNFSAKSREVFLSSMPIIKQEVVDAFRNIGLSVEVSFKESA